MKAAIIALISWAAYGCCLCGAALVKESPLETIGAIMRSASAAAVPDTTDFGEISNVFQDMARLPPPRSVHSQLMDPTSSLGTLACQRDYKAPCPQDFVELGNEARCVAGSRYTGPCSGTAYSFAKFSNKAKALWSDQCLTSWPCVRCRRDFHKPCPEGWVANVSSAACHPPASYTGYMPCSHVFLFWPVLCVHGVRRDSCLVSL